MYFVVLQNDCAVRIDDEADIEKAVGPVLMARLRLRHDKGAPAAREPPEAVGFRAGDVDRTGPRKFGVIDVENLVIEPLHRAFRNGDQTHRDVETGQPECGLCQAFEVFEVLLDVFAAANTPEARDQSHHGIGLDHVASPEVDPKRRLSDAPEQSRFRPRTSVEAAPHSSSVSISRDTVSMSAIPSTRRRIPRAR